MCSARIYYEMYHRHVGHNTPYHDRLVRLARELIRAHEATCSLCRCYGGTNYNLQPPRRSRMGARP